MPQITIGVIVLVILAYLAGAKWPGMARMVGM